MKAADLHPWNITPAAAAAVQQKLRDRVERGDGFGEVRTVAGVDVGYEDAGRTARAAVVLLAVPTLDLVEHAQARVATPFPYVPGPLSLREVPAALAAFERLRGNADLVLCDGQGIAHPRRFGIASHLGDLLDRPSIGAAKTRLVGEHRAPPQRRGAWTPLVGTGEVIGAVPRTRSGVKPGYVSIGHRVGLDNAVRWVMACVTRYRLPETTRWAHRLASGQTLSAKAGTR